MCRSSSYDNMQNEYYENDIRYTFQVCKWVLKLIGIQPLISKHAGRLDRVGAVIVMVLCSCAVHFVTIPFGYYILFCEKDLAVKVKFLGPLIFCVTVFLKYCYLIVKRSEFRRCIQHVKMDWRNLKDQGHREIMLRHATTSRNLIFICLVFYYSGALSYHVVMPLMSSNQIVGNVTIRPITYPGYELFFDIQKTPMYEIVYALNCIYVIVVCTIVMAAYCLTTIFTTHACGQIEIQKTRLENLRNERDTVVRAVWGTFLATVVKKHVEILRFARNVKEILGELLLMEIVTCTLEMCLIEYYCLTVWETNDLIVILTYFILLASFTFNILIFCYIGELLLGQGNQISSASYETEWYNVPGRKARDIVLLIAISKYPPKLTAGKMVDLSLLTFGTVLKTSVVYLNMLRTVTDT